MNMKHLNEYEKDVLEQYRVPSSYDSMLYAGFAMYWELIPLD